MKVFVYAAVDEGAPASAIAMIYHGGKQGWHPVHFTAPTPEEARAAAQRWWDAEVERERNKRPRGRPKKASPAPDYVL